MINIFICLCFVILSGCSVVETNLPESGLSEKHSQKAVDCADIDTIISNKEKEYEIPKGLLKSIASVESKTCPFAINEKKKSHYFTSKKDACDFVNTAIKNGTKNMSIGCFQLHYLSHRKNFCSIDDMINPETNASYAAKLLRALYDRYGSWDKAIQKYHSGRSKNNVSYYKRVMKSFSSNRIN